MKLYANLLLIVGFTLCNSSVIIDGPVSSISTTSTNEIKAQFGSPCKSDFDCQSTDPETVCHKSAPHHLVIGVCLCKPGYVYDDDDSCKPMERGNMVESKPHVSGMKLSYSQRTAIICASVATAVACTAVAIIIFLQNFNKY